MIPKIIHYCWFGYGEIPEKDKKCIKSWKKYCPDYEIIRWDESNYDISKNKYMREAYEAKVWGFVPDFARLDLIYQYGGIYLDTDVELIKPLDDLLNNKAFMGFESEEYVAPGLGFGAQKNSAIIKELIGIYENRSFIRKDGTSDITASPIMITELLVSAGLVQNGKFQIIKNELSVYPVEYFCPLDYERRELNITERTYSIHHYAASWMPEEERIAHDTRAKMIRKYGKKKGLFIAKIVNFPIRLKFHLKDKGIVGTIIFTLNKLVRIRSVDN